MAFFDACTVIVEDPLPEIDDGLNVTDAPLLVPEADKVTVPVNPDRAEIVTESPMELPRLTVIGDPAPIVKSPAPVDDTVRFTEVVSVVPSEVFPVTVMGNVPVVAVALAVKVRTEVSGGPLTGFVPNAAVTPEGKVDVLRVTPELNVPVTETVMVEVFWLPCVTVTELGEAERLKLPCCWVPVRALISVTVGLPQPVTRSKPVTAEKLPEVPLLMSWKSAA